MTGVFDEKRCQPVPVARMRFTPPVYAAPTDIAGGERTACSNGGQMTWFDTLPFRTTPLIPHVHQRCAHQFTFLTQQTLRRGADLQREVCSPPLTAMTWPVIWRAAGLARNAAVPAMSWGRLGRRVSAESMSA